jgi:LuxR family quorum sensing-dependent transcriptional regulator
LGTPPDSSDIARRAFDAIAAAHKADSLLELDAALGRQIVDLGFDAYVGVNVLDPGGTPNHSILFGKTHEAWEKHYTERGFHRHDAVLRELVSGIDPLFWSDVLNKRPLEPEEIRIYNEAADFGLKEGFMTPVHGLDGSLSAVLLVGNHVDAMDPDTRAAAHMLSLYYGAMAHKIRRAERLRLSRPVRLSPRQIECLKWVRHGKSSNDIGDILGLSGRTVDHYLASACEKLGVRTRHQAVIDASIRGFFQL